MSPQRRASTRRLRNQWGRRDIVRRSLHFPQKKSSQIFGPFYGPSSGLHELSCIQQTIYQKAMSITHYIFIIFALSQHTRERKKCFTIRWMLTAFLRHRDKTIECHVMSVMSLLASYWSWPSEARWVVTNWMTHRAPHKRFGQSAIELKSYEDERSTSEEGIDATIALMRPA